MLCEEQVSLVVPSFSISHTENLEKMKEKKSFGVFLRIINFSNFHFTEYALGGFPCEILLNFHIFSSFFVEKLVMIHVLLPFAL